MDTPPPTDQQPCPDDILAQSAALMSSQGYHGTSMRDLARTTGRSLSGLYHHFANKEELLYLINQRGFSPLLANAERLRSEYRSGNGRPVAAAPASAALLCDLIGSHLGYFGSHLNEMRVLMFGTQPMSSAHGKAIRQLKERYTEIFKFAVGQYIETRREAATAIEIERKTYLLFGMMNWIFGWYSFDEHGPAEALAEEIYTTFTKGCLALRPAAALDE
ncbi:MAG: TetR/AcrR family transcriptional regulator [Xanthomonadaceae bacterium]|jgi:AcrR family transcriptional regulator|nr:TetR/AcrR family transcriptional regulator [Xanthomonadaceae bacterium]MDE3071101.1 TetR/AcrR family transcriptional regulator [Pseudomonadota bacterium]